jgi:glycosyltransferase involved in cell wall biosynthesis
VTDNRRAGDPSTPTLPCIGWIGQRSTAHFLQPLAGLLADMLNHGIAQSVAIGLDAAAIGLPMASQPWSEEDEVAALQSLDIGIMPLNDGPFERGKCGYKLIQYMACGLPVVASPVGVNCELVKHGVNGFLADSPQDWRESLTTLCKDASLRQQMGAAGRKLVESQFSLAAMAPKLANIFRELASPSQP